MSKRKKMAFWIGVTIGILLVLLVALILLLPYLVNLESVRQRIIVELSRGTGGEVAFQRIDLSLLPRPRVVIHQGSLSIPGRIDGTLESLTVYPEILPLLWRQVRVTRLQVESPDIKAELPVKKKEREKKREAVSLETIPETLAPVFALLEEEAPGLVLLVNGGRLQISEGNRSIFWFEDIDGSIRLPPGRLRVDLRCTSNLWESLSVEGWLDSKEFKSNGRLTLIDFQPQILAKQFFPLASPRLSDSRVNFDLSFQADGSQLFRAELKGSMPLLTVHHGDNKLAFKNKSLQAAFERDRSATTVTLTELSFDYPQLSLSGKLSIDQETPRVSVELEGREVDVASTRQVALALAGKEPTIQVIFDLLRGGRVPLITLSSQGSSLADLDDLKNIFIMGSMVDGNVFIRGSDYGWEGVDLNLEDAKGDVVISQGIIEGNNLEARWENEQIREGILKLGLEGEDAPLHLEALIEIDLSQLDPLLKRLIKQEELAAEIGRIYGVKGKGVGRLVVGERVDSITVKVDVSELNLFARHEKIPYGLQVNSGQVLYDEQKFGLKDLNGKFGKSSFSEVTAQMDFEEAPGLEILSGRFLINLDEIYSWLSSPEGLGDVFKDIKSVSGTLGLSTLNLKGPLLNPQAWRFRATGEVKSVALDSTFFPGPVAINQGEFEATPEQLMFKDTQTRMLDASLQVSGDLTGYQEGIKKADLALQGTLGPEIMEWGASLIDLPPKLKVRSPLLISQAQANWDRDGRTLISGNFAVNDGPEVAVDVALDPNALMINKVVIRDEASQATFGATLKERELHLNYKGQLDRTTLNRLLVRNEMVTGKFDGDFEAHILLDHPMRSTAQGRIRGVGLGHPLELKTPLVFENLSLKAEKSTIKVESALVTWGESRLSLDGDLKVSEEDFLFDMNLSADGIGWKQVEQMLEKDDKEGGPEAKENPFPSVVEGILRVKLGYLEYGNFTWKPFHANISLDDNGVEVQVTEANLCGISTPGTVKITGQDLSLDFKPAGGGQELETTLLCLSDGELRTTGDFEFKSDIRSQGRNEDLVKALSGDFEFKSSDGLIKRDVRVARVLGFLNLTEALTGRLPDMGKKGIAYNSIQVLGNFENGKFRIKEGVLDAKAFDLSTQGQIDLIDKKMDLIVLVAPQKTLDRAVKLIPGVRHILGGSLISYPVRVRGDLKKPKISALSPSAVGSELLGIMKRTIGLPTEMIQPLRPNKEKKQNAPQE